MHIFLYVYWCICIDAYSPCPLGFYLHPTSTSTDNQHSMSKSHAPSRFDVGKEDCTLYLWETFLSIRSRIYLDKFIFASVAYGPLPLHFSHDRAQHNLCFVWKSDLALPSHPVSLKLTGLHRCTLLWQCVSYTCLYFQSTAPNLLEMNGG